MGNDDARPRAEAVPLLSRSSVGLGMDHERRRQSEEGPPQRRHPCPCDRDSLLAAVEHLVKLDDDGSSQKPRQERNGEVGVEHRSRPPLEDDDVRLPPPQPVQVPKEAWHPVPIDAFQHLDTGVVVQPRGRLTRRVRARDTGRWG